MRIMRLSLGFLEHTVFLRAVFLLQSFVLQTASPSLALSWRLR